MSCAILAMPMYYQHSKGPCTKSSITIIIFCEGKEKCARSSVREELTANFPTRSRPCWISSCAEFSRDCFWQIPYFPSLFVAGLLESLQFMGIARIQAASICFMFDWCLQVSLLLLTHWSVVSHSTCTCPIFAKQNICKHNFGMAIRLKLTDVQSVAKIKSYTVALGQKRKRGRPSKAKPTLQFQYVLPNSRLWTCSTLSLII